MALLTANPAYKSITRQELAPVEVVPLLEAFQHLAGIATGEKGLDVITLLSTCPTHRNTYNACAHQVEAWLRSGESDFDILLSSIEQIHVCAELKGRSLFPEMDGDLSAVGRSALAGSNPSLERCIDTCDSALSEYLRKRSIFHDRFQELYNVARGSCNRTGPGRRFWKHYIEDVGFARPDRSVDIDRRFRDLDLSENLAWHLTRFVVGVLANCGLVRGAQGHPHDVSKFAKDYNIIVRSNTSLCGAIIHQELSDAIQNPVSANWRQWWEMFLNETRQCFFEIRRFFDTFVPKLFHDAFDPYLPPSKDRETALGSRESLTHNAYVLFFDIVRSKKTDVNVKDLLTKSIRSTHPTVICPQKAVDPSDDAFVIVTTDWGSCLTAAQACHSVASGLPWDGDGFGGVRMSLQIGPILKVTSSDGIVVARDTDAANTIAQAAYLSDGIKAVLLDAGGFRDAIVMSVETKNYIVEQGYLPAEKFMDIPGEVIGKDGYRAQASKIDVFAT